MIKKMIESVRETWLWSPKCQTGVWEDIVSLNHTKLGFLMIFPVFINSNNESTEHHCLPWYWTLFFIWTIPCSSASLCFVFGWKNHLGGESKAQELIYCHCNWGCNWSIKFIALLLYRMLVERIWLACVQKGWNCNVVQPPHESLCRFCCVCVCVFF